MQTDITDLKWIALLLDEFYHDGKISHKEYLNLYQSLLQQGVIDDNSEGE